MKPSSRKLGYVWMGVLAWLLVTLVAVWPVAKGQIASSYYVWALQVAPLLYLAIVVVYAWVMNRDDKQHDDGTP